MKNTILLLALFFSTVIVAQTGINYKAIVKDNNGNILANQTVDFEFTIIKSIGMVNTYTEFHDDVETDSNGIIILKIGGGIASLGDFSLINWKDDQYLLNIRIDIGNGLVDLGTTEFNEVPFAVTSKAISNAANRTLEISGTGQQRIRINSDDGNIPSLELMRTGSNTDWKIQNSNQWLDLMISDNDFSSTEIKFSFHEEGKLGINNTNPQEELHVDGTIRSTSLSGAGIRKVSANEEGNLIIDNTLTTSYLSLNSDNFNEYDGTGVYYRLTAINLPHNAIIRNIKLYYEDTSFVSDIVIDLWGIPVNTVGYNPISEIQSVGFSDGIKVADSGTIYHLVQNQSTTYTMQISATNGWSSSTMEVRAIIIEYFNP